MAKSKKVTLTHPTRTDIVCDREWAEMIIEKQKSWSVPKSQHWKIKEDAVNNRNKGDSTASGKDKGDKEGADV